MEDAAAIELFLKDIAQIEPIKEREEYLDNPQILTPLALAQSIGHPVNGDKESHKQHERLGWRCFYLLALFPLAYLPSQELCDVLAALSCLFGICRCPSDRGSP